LTEQGKTPDTTFDDGLHKFRRTTQASRVNRLSCRGVGPCSVYRAWTFCCKKAAAARHTSGPQDERASILKLILADQVAARQQPRTRVVFFLNSARLCDQSAPPGHPIHVATVHHINTNISRPKGRRITFHFDAPNDKKTIDTDPTIRTRQAPSQTHP